MSITLFGITFYAYGLLMGLAVVVGWWLVEKALVLHAIKIPHKDVLFGLMILGGLIGARAWHGYTDWHVYADNPLALLYIWNGGLSIIGAVMGAVITGALALPRLAPQVSLLTVTDALVYGLPVGQIIGRLGNYVNYELYGMPSKLPWAIPIPVEHRLPSVVSFSHFHPLFLYESLVLALIAGLIWKKRWRPGSGWATLFYLCSYAWARWALDFLRIERGSLILGMGVNQWLLLLVALVCTGLLGRRLYQAKVATMGK